MTAAQPSVVTDHEGTYIRIVIDKWGAKAIAKCVSPECKHNPWGRTEDDLKKLLHNSGWVCTSRGWLCPEHLRFALAAAEAVELVRVADVALIGEK